MSSGSFDPAPLQARLRLFVIGVLVFSLFLTLFARLWYMQVLSSEDYSQAATKNHTREVLIPAPRGAVVDAAGRTLVGNRVSLVITVDRSVLAKLPDAQQQAMLDRLAKVLGQKPADLRARTMLCGEPGASKPPACWNGTPYQPIPVAKDVSAQVAIEVMERREDFPGVGAESATLRAYPAPYGVNAAHVVGYLSPITTSELDELDKSGQDSVPHRSDLVGRAGLERTYDAMLRGTPGVKNVVVDAIGYTTGVEKQTSPVPGATLVTSIDARIQAAVEKELRSAILTARKQYDKITKRNYVADSGAAVVMDTKTGQVVAMASYPTYDPRVWVGGISQRELDALYSPASGTPLLSRALQGQLAPGSTFKPITTAAAMGAGYGPKTRLDCTSFFEVGDRKFKNYESASYGMIGFDEALALSCDTFFYRIAYDLWLKEGGDSSNIDAFDPLVEMAKKFGLGRPTGVDLPGEAAGRIADRKWKKQYYDAQKDYYCKLAERPPAGTSAFLKQFSREFCVDGYRYRAGDAVNFAIGQGDTTLTPVQLATVYSALSNGGILWEPRVAKKLVGPNGKVQPVPAKISARLPVPATTLRYIDRALQETVRTGTAAWKFNGFPLDRVPVRAKTGTAEVYGKQTTSWLASYTDRYAVVMMISQAGTGSGASGTAVRRIYEALYNLKPAAPPAKQATP
ncbi:penicillin-binding protein 2 [Kribbella flavida DSM 17836]|uniref:Penicillin-binding protein 2 n=1 Tax=Kribbella flavida (strain DSM 17836 / JCM 10339 / NBRC 14399) TaxID=479435 RepID=D2PTR5_KRIFD|nr:penicillin-binding protein 2 [Kribbella flavida]ADB31378.1 penicillin-binding protein 2 [Kribbella flavida DSM 17836]